MFKNINTDVSLLNAPSVLTATAIYVVSHYTLSGYSRRFVRRRRRARRTKQPHATIHETPHGSRRRRRADPRPWVSVGYLVVITPIITSKSRGLSFSVGGDSPACWSWPAGLRLIGQVATTEVTHISGQLHGKVSLIGSIAVRLACSCHCSSGAACESSVVRPPVRKPS